MAFAGELSGLSRLLTRARMVPKQSGDCEETLGGSSPWIFRSVVVHRFFAEDFPIGEDVGFFDLRSLAC
ncbi:hypothetical protein RHGRI_033846 [Rhododendron griersonianum]|uniref:Uncharacterized protein n=1 Tax=Rhododendron griersonianum TaxID=479676 RepID=A0AAV6I255_9ERIC|nr:hypothetical protein RHGRI_033846 [Rhododendron griersonianum]